MRLILHSAFLAAILLLAGGMPASAQKRDTTFMYEYYAPKNNGNKIQDDILKGVYDITREYLESYYLIRADEKSRNQLTELETRNQKNYTDLQPGKEPPIVGRYELEYHVTSDNKYLFTLCYAHTLKKDSRKYRSDTAIEEVFMTKPEAQKLAAYEILKKIDILTEEDILEIARLKKWLNEKRDEAIQEPIKENTRYNRLSILPGVNQIRSGTRRGNIAAGVTWGGMAVSAVSFFVIPTLFRNEIEDLNAQLSLVPANEAARRNTLEQQIEGYRQGQSTARWVSGGVFLGCWVLSFIDARFLGKSTYFNSNDSVTVAPVAYEGGAGLSLVYKF